MGADMTMIMDTDALHDTGPFGGVATNDLLPSGTFVPQFTRVTYGPQNDSTGNAPQGGIDYIDQAVGGVQGYRADAAAGPVRGIRSYRSRTQPFNGDFIGTTLLVPNRVQGKVGLQKGNIRARVEAPITTNLADDSAVAAAFINPALGRFINKMRGL